MLFHPLTLGSMIFKMITLLPDTVSDDGWPQIVSSSWTVPVSSVLSFSGFSGSTFWWCSGSTLPVRPVLCLNLHYKTAHYPLFPSLPFCHLFPHRLRFSVFICITKKKSRIRLLTTYLRFLHWCYDKKQGKVRGQAAVLPLFHHPWCTCLSRSQRHSRRCPAYLPWAPG